MSLTYQEYEEHLDRIGEAILDWADADKNFRGHTEVSYFAIRMKEEIQTDSVKKCVHTNFNDNDSMTHTVAFNSF
jgi:hypothetical protein